MYEVLDAYTDQLDTLVREHLSAGQMTVAELYHVLPHSQVSIARSLRRLVSDGLIEMRDEVPLSDHKDRTAALVGGRFWLSARAL